MKRNQIKMIAAALYVMMVMAFGCGKQSEGEEVVDSIGEQSEEPSQEVTFQDQYDLGMRLLSEGSYEEAIIAFQAALEINPKSVDIYTAMADTYEAMGDTEGLRRILEQGIEATGDAGLQERLSQLLPQLPEGLDWTESDYVANEEELETIFTEAIENGLAGNQDFLRDTAWNSQLAEQVGTYLKARRENSGERIGLVSEKEDRVTYRLWTVLSDGALFKYDYAKVGQGLNFNITYRPQNGSGFTLRVTDYLAEESAHYYYYLTQGEMAGWLYNGSFTNQFDSLNYRDGVGSAYYTQTWHITGTAVDDLLDGERVSVVHYRGDNGNETDFTRYENFKAGERQVTWTDEDGKDCDQMDVDAAGEVTYRKFSGDSRIWYPWSS